MRLPAALRARLRDLRLAVRGASGAGGLGLHASRSRGAGLEFAQYRGYEPGDEPRRIDWKLFARSDRYFVRESERDSPLTAWIVVDASASMGLADGVDPSTTKLDDARLLAACVLELAVRQGERFGLALLASPAPTWVTPAGGTRQRDRCLLDLERATSAGAMPAEAALRPLWERIEPGALVVVLSDMFDDALVAHLERLSAARREVVVIQVIGADERDFPFRGGHRFVDPEDGAELRVDAPAARADYVARFAAARAALAARLAAAGVRVDTHVLGEPVDAVLRRLFGSGPAARRA